MLCVCVNRKIGEYLAFDSFSPKGSMYCSISVGILVDHPHYHPSSPPPLSSSPSPLPPIITTSTTTHHHHLHYHHHHPHYHPSSPPPLSSSHFLANTVHCDLATSLTPRPKWLTLQLSGVRQYHCRQHGDEPGPRPLD